MKNFVSSSPEESKKIAQNFTKEILVKKRQENSALVVALYGDLGFGSTFLLTGVYYWQIYASKNLPTLRPDCQPSVSLLRKSWEFFIFAGAIFDAREAAVGK